MSLPVPAVPVAAVTVLLLAVAASSARPAAVAAPPTAAAFTINQSSNNCYGDPPACWFRGRTGSAAQCEALCAADTACRSFVWVGNTGDNFAHECRTRNGTVWQLVPLDKHTSGFKSTAPVPPPFHCQTVRDCTLSGACVDGACVCDKPWTGARCQQLKLKPAKLAAPFKPPVPDPEHIRFTWGAAPFQPAGEDGRVCFYFTWLLSWPAPPPLPLPPACTATGVRLHACAHARTRGTEDSRDRDCCTIEAVYQQHVARATCMRATVRYCRPQRGLPAHR